MGLLIQQGTSGSWQKYTPLLAGKHWDFELIYAKLPKPIIPDGKPLFMPRQIHLLTRIVPKNALPLHAF